MTAIHIAMVMGIKMIKSRADTPSDADVTYYVIVIVARTHFVIVCYHCSLLKL